MKTKREHKKEEESGSDSSSDESDDSRRRKKSKKKRKKRSHKKKSRHEYSDDDDSSQSTDRERRKRRKKERSKKSSKKSSKEKRERKSAQGPDISSNAPAVDATVTTSRTADDGQKPPSPGIILGNHLFRLFAAKPDFAADLPFILIRLAGGSTFDLRQMTDRAVAVGLQEMFMSLSAFGVEQSPESGLWYFNAPAGKGDERILLRATRALLDEAGLTMQAVRKYDVENANSAVTPQNQEEPQEPETTQLQKIHGAVVDLLQDFYKPGSGLHKDLCSLCEDLLDGQSISLEGLPDAELKQCLEAVFLLCNLEQCEMEEDSDEEEEQSESDDGPTLGLCISEETSERTRELVTSVIQSCNKLVSPEGDLMIDLQRPTKSRQKVVPAKVVDNSDESDDEGPAPVGAKSRRPRGPTLPPELVKMQAEERAAQLQTAVTGIKPAAKGGREEWMLEPGKADILGAIKTGQIKGQANFKNKKTRAKEVVVKPIDAKVQSEIDSIMQAHADARGPTLMDQHRAKKQQEKIEKASGKQSWKWNREKDLDEGRRVDKDALQMILGGATGDLKTKFQGGYR